MPIILVVIPSISNKAGMERAITNLANILNDSNFKITICSIYSSSSTGFILNEGIDVIHLGIQKSNYLKIATKIRHLTKKIQPNFIIGTEVSINVLLPIITFGISVFTIGCEHFNYDAPSSRSKFLRKIMYRLLSKVVVLTHNDKKRYSFLKNVTVIPNSLSFESLEVSSLIEKKIVAVGRMDSQKGFDMLLSIASLSKNKLPDWSFHIYGDGPDRQELIRTIEEKELSNVNLHNWVANVHDIMCESSIFALTSRFEGLPMVLLEATTCGLPIISFDCPEGPSEVIVDGFNGFLIPCFNEELFVSKLVFLCEEDRVRQKMGFNAKQISKKFNSEHVGELWLNLIRTCK